MTKPNPRLKELEREVALEKARANHAEINLKVMTDKHDEIADRNHKHSEFLIKIAKRLGIHPLGPQDRIQSMVDDAIRKLLS